MLTTLFLAARIVANPVVNVLQKRLTQHSANPVFIIGTTHALLTLATLPLFVAPMQLRVGGTFWTNMAVAAVLAVAGNVLLVYALSATDLSILGPINAYKAVVALVLGTFLVGEFPTAMGLAGVLLIFAGSVIVVDRDPLQPNRNAFAQFFRERGVQFRFAALAVSATEAVFLKRAMLASSPLTTFLGWCVLGLPIAAAAMALLPGASTGKDFVVLRRHWQTYACLGVMTGVMQAATLFTFGRLQVGYSLALFQLSTIISVLFGYRYFQERHFRRRMAGALVMVAGAVLIVVLGRRG